MTADPHQRLNSALEGRYRIERELGAGGMATVYVADDLKHERRVAVKVLRPELTAALGADRFPREIRIVAQFNHPHVLALYDSGAADGHLYYVMPYVDGESLRQRLEREGELPVGEAIRILREVTDALSYAHERDIVHRDIKPDNVMLSGRHALVTDFGVAKAVSEAGGDKLTTVGVAVGTPTYMSPEQATGESKVDHRADIYALGVLGYEMLTGAPPFEGATAKAILTAHIMADPPDLRQLRPTVPTTLADALTRCLAKNAADRWQTAGELLAVLETIDTTPSGGITPTDTRMIQARPGRKRSIHRTWIVAGAVAVMGVAAAGGWLFGAGRSGGGVERIAVLPIEDISGQDSVFVDAMHASLTTALGGLGAAGVASRSTMMLYKNDPKSSREIAREQDLDAVLDMTVFRAGDVMSINVQFQDPVTTRILWSDMYERNVADVLAAQNDIVQRIAAGVASALGVSGGMAQSGGGE